VIQVEDETAITQLALAEIVSCRELGGLPGLPLILAEVLNDVTVQGGRCPWTCGDGGSGPYRS
jgi:hypothetical protein